MEMDRELFVADLLSLEMMAYDLYVNARFQADKAMGLPAGSTDRDVCMNLAVSYQRAARRVAAGAIEMRLLALAKGI